MFSLGSVAWSTLSAFEWPAFSRLLLKQPENQETSKLAAMSHKLAESATRGIREETQE